MADFATHLSVSTAAGVGYGLAGFRLLELPPETCVLAGGLCSLAGVLPDLDSDSGKPVREILSFSAAASSVLLVGRLEEIATPSSAFFGSHESLVLAGAAAYLLVRFGLGTLLKKATTHRGMFHSVPAAAIAGLVGFLLVSGLPVPKLYKAAALSLGYAVHLLLDELWSIDLRWGIPRLKKSSGTAVKFFGSRLGSNAATYGLLILLTMAAFSDLAMTASGRAVDPLAPRLTNTASPETLRR